MESARTVRSLAMKPSIALGLVGCVIALSISATSTTAAEPSSISELLKALSLSGYPSPMHAPEFTGFTSGGKKITSADLRGRVVLLNFWATWCLECRPEMSVFEQLHRELLTRGLVVMGINAREGTSTIRQYAKELGLTFPLIADPRGKINADYGVIGLPTTFLIRRNGRAVALAVGPREWNGREARSLIEALLTEAAPVK